ncbi:MAG: hypothetical protein LH478_05020 [Chitinophagaceae bacterium]|nr:hypothetical protein [Chitinophagaceae bacterium]
MKTNLLSILLFEQTNFMGSFFIVVLFILVLLTIAAIFYLYISSKTKERLALIEKGMDPNLARGDFLTQVSIISGGFAFGLIAGDKIPFGYGPLVGIILAAVGVVSYNIIKRKKMEKRSGKL